MCPSFFSVNTYMLARVTFRKTCVSIILFFHSYRLARVTLWKTCVSIILFFHSYRLARVHISLHMQSQGFILLLPMRQRNQKKTHLWIIFCWTWVQCSDVQNISQLWSQVPDWLCQESENTTRDGQTHAHVYSSSLKITWKAYLW